MKHLEAYRGAVSDPFGYARHLKKETGKKIIGYTCSYTPEEMILAAGAHPLRLFGTRENIHLADSHLQAYCCSVVRGILEEALSGRADFLDGMVFPHTCDSIQRLSDIWRMNISFGFHLDLILPVKLDTLSARDYMADVLKKFRTDLGRLLQTDISDKALEKALGTTNTIRGLIRDVYELRSRSPQIMPAADLYTLVRAAMIMDRDGFATMLSETVSELKAQAGTQSTSGGKRILLAGGICNHPDIYTIIEQAGGAVVWDDFCTGSRYFSELADQGGDPIARIADRFLNRIVCPAKHMDLDGRARHLIRLAKEKDAKGVLLLILKFCDPHAFDYPYIKEMLEKAEVPLMMVEIEDPLPAEGQLKTRFEAFLEML